MRTKGTTRELEVRRRIAGNLLLDGEPLQEVAEVVGASLSSVKRWKRAVKEGGLEALAAKRHPGPEPKLSEDQRQELKDILLAGPIKAGYHNELWTCPRVAQVIYQQFGVEYHTAHVWKVLRSLGFTCQKPEQKAREQDTAAMDRWRRSGWQALKRGRAPAS
jgi:transposase